MPSAFLPLPKATQPHAGQVMGLEVPSAKHWQSPQRPSPVPETLRTVMPQHWGVKPSPPDGNCQLTLRIFEDPRELCLLLDRESLRGNNLGLWDSVQRHFRKLLLGGEGSLPIKMGAPRGRLFLLTLRWSPGGD